MYYKKSCPMPKNEGKIELHAHTTASDGHFTPQDLVLFAQESGITHLAITDHDTTAGLAAAREQSAKLPIEIIAGIELSAMHLGREIHILGYYIDDQRIILQNKLRDLFEDRFTRAERMVKKFNSLGYPIKFDDIKAKTGPKGLLGRPHIALVLIDYGIVTCITEAFDKYLNPGRPGYVPRMKLSPQEAIKLIKAADGIPVLAHPGLNFPLSLLPDCLDAGLLGIECYHPRHNPAQTQMYLEIAHSYNLVVTGGSDFHGYERDDWKFFGNITPIEALQQLQQVKETTRIKPQGI